MWTLDVRLPAKVVIGNLVFILYASGLQPLEILGSGVNIVLYDNIHVHKELN